MRLFLIKCLVWMLERVPGVWSVEVFYDEDEDAMAKDLGNRFADKMFSRVGMTDDLH